MQKYRILQLTVLIVILPTLRLAAQPELHAAKVDRNVVFGMYSGLLCLWMCITQKIQMGMGLFKSLEAAGRDL